jgi:hypothetical protein
VKTVNMSDENWMVIVVDQCWHIIVLGLITQLF